MENKKSNRFFKMSLNFDTICRTCMTQSQALMCIFDDQISSPNDVILMLHSITSIRANKNDGLPGNICIACVAEINRAFSFKNRSERSENTLRQYLNRLTKANIDPKISNDDHYEIIEMDEEERTELTTGDFKTETDMDESSSNLSSTVLDRRKILVLPSDESASNSINVVYECHICYETFDSITLSQQHLNNVHGSSAGLKEENLNVDESVNQSIDEDAQYATEYVNSVETTITTPVERNEKEIPDVTYERLTTNDEIVPIIVMTGNESAEPELKYNCKKCGGKFAKERSLNIHIKLNKCTIKSFKCKICSKVFVRKKNLDCHMQTHNEPSEYACKVCSDVFQQADELAIHIQKQHEPSKKFLCPHCWKGFNVSSSLKDHIRVHNGERPFLCSICGKGFSQSTNLNQHVMRHNKTKPYECSICSYSFVSKGELNAHSRKHTGLHPFVCELCGASFTTSSSLVKHTRIHTGERPYACEYCPMRFAALGTLKNHTRTHNGARPFACGICGRTFSQRSDCLSHQETHSANKSYFCKVCYKSFHKKSGLRNHMKTHRNDGTDGNGSDVVTVDHDEMKLACM